MATGRRYHTATLLPNGLVLVAGGSGDNTFLASAELYDPASNTWSAAGSLATARYEQTATLLPNGKVLVAGGRDNTGPNSSPELYDPASNTWSAAGSLATGRQYHTAALLPNGTVLVAGGNGGNPFLASAELYDPASDTWSAAGSLVIGRNNHTATLLPSGKVLVAGGYNTTGTLGSAELYTSGPTVTSISPTSGPTQGGTAVTITGTGFTGATAATVCGAAFTGLTVVSDTSITGTTPAHAVTATACDVAVTTTAGGSGTGTAMFSYAAPSATGTPPGATDPFTVSFTGGSATCDYASTQFISAAAAGGSLPAGYSFAQGAFGFTTTHCGTGAALNVTLTFAQPVPTGAKLFKLVGITWTALVANISGNTVTYTVTDGGAGDTNPIPGVITDPVALGLPIAAFGTATPIPTLGQWALVLLSLLVASLGAMVVRRMQPA